MTKYVAHEDDFFISHLLGRSFKLIVGSKAMPCQAINGGVSFFPPMAHSPGHVHNHEEEVIYCVEGQGEILIDGQAEAICPGSFVVVPPQKLHSINNTGSKTIKLLYMFSPKCDIGNYPDITSDKTGK